LQGRMQHGYVDLARFDTHVKEVFLFVSDYAQKTNQKAGLPTGTMVCIGGEDGRIG